MEFERVVRARRMVRAFRPDPIPADTVTALIDLATRAPSAGNSQGSDFVVLSGPDQTEAFWAVTMSAPRRETFAWPHLFTAPVLIIPVGDARRYTSRYGESDKVNTGLGQSAQRWAVPYWQIDTAMATMTLLHAAVDVGLGALFFGLFDNTEAVKAAFGIPEMADPIGAVALGWPAHEADRPSRSAQRPRRPLSEVVHRGRW